MYNIWKILFVRKKFVRNIQNPFWDWFIFNQSGSRKMAQFFKFLIYPFTQMYFFFKLPRKFSNFQEHKKMAKFSDFGNFHWRCSEFRNYNQIFSISKNVLFILLFQIYFSHFTRYFLIKYCDKIHVLGTNFKNVCCEIDTFPGNFFTDVLILIIHIKKSVILTEKWNV